MALYVTVSAGPRADQSVPVMVVSDRRVIDAVMAAITALLGEDDTRQPAPSTPLPIKRARGRSDVAGASLGLVGARHQS